MLSQPLVTKPGQKHKCVSCHFKAKGQSSFSIYTKPKKYGCIEMTLTLNIPFLVFSSIVWKSKCLNSLPKFSRNNGKNNVPFLPKTMTYFFCLECFLAESQAKTGHPKNQETLKIFLVTSMMNHAFYLK